jgi:hypothetical protein
MPEPSEEEASAAESPAPRADPVQQLWLLWRQGQRADVQQYLDQAGPLTPPQVAAVLLVDQRERWLIGERLRAESYLPLYPMLRADLEFTVELIYGEFLLREELGEGPTLDEDLERFLSGKPVTARRTGLPEQAWRWCRRKPTVATLTAAVTLLLMAVAVGSALSALWLRDQRNDATEKLWGSYLDQAKAGRLSRRAGQRFKSAGRLSRRAGQRFKSLDALAKAAQIARERHMPPERFLELRNEAIACLALPDLRLAKQWDGWPAGSLGGRLRWHAGALRPDGQTGGRQRPACGRRYRDRPPPRLRFRGLAVFQPRRPVSGARPTRWIGLRVHRVEAGRPRVPPAGRGTGRRRQRRVQPRLPAGRCPACEGRLH